MAVEAVGVLGGAPFVVLCGMTASVATLVVSLTLWGFFKGLYDANIFASAFDVVPPEARGRTAGFMNMIGWLAGGGSAPVAIGFIAERTSLGAALALTSLVYVAAAALLIAGMMMVKRGRLADQAWIRTVQCLCRLTDSSFPRLIRLIGRRRELTGARGWGLGASCHLLGFHRS